MPTHSNLPQLSPTDYPDSPRGEVVETLHGVEVADPYRWLEDIDSEETTKWVSSQAAFTEAYLAKLPGREAFRKRLEAMWDYDKFGIPRKVEGGKLIYSRKTGLQNQSVLYWREDAPNADEHVLLDPNSFSKDGTVALSGTRVSNNGKLIAYGISKSGSDWQEWKIRDIESGEDLDDHLEWIKFSGCSWAPDDKSLLYSRYDEPEQGKQFKDENYYQKVYRHIIGTDQKDDQLVYERPDQKTWGFGAGYTDDGNYLLFHVWEGAASDNALFYRDLSKGPGSDIVELVNEFDAKYNVVGNDGEVFYLWTNRDAPNGKLVSVDLKNPAPDQWQTLIAEDEKKNLRGVSYLGGKFIAEYLVDVREEVEVFDSAGESLGPLELPNFGTVYGFGGKQKDRETFYMVTGFATPGTIYRYNVETGTSEKFIEPELAFDTAEYETEQVFFSSKDGTQIPMYLTYRKGLQRDGNNPVILYGYGGFNISLGPQFSISRTAWMEKGGVYAQVNLRGGGEYGESWHEAGMGLKKQNVFDDFISAAEFLISEKYTSSKKLAISGGSNGGLLVAACLNQRPDLFGAALPSVGVHDMLRFQKFTIGWAWQKEYGYPEDNEADFKNLLSYSPVHNTKKGTEFPPVLIQTADHDDRVFPAHSFKYAAQLQHAQAGSEPVLIRIETKAGHGAGKPTEKIIEELADVYAFLFSALSMEIE
ncbi:MAG: prolyl oligopeptidase family serine peptidase [Verrucomicrobiales bacterium]|nr:prolyl oligopeptidase family serine peptidase [Verrucomicrobiales bacterium]